MNVLTAIALFLLILAIIKVPFVIYCYIKMKRQEKEDAEHAREKFRSQDSRR